VALAPFAVPELLLFHYRAYADPLLVMMALTGFAWTLAGAVHWDRAELLGGGLALAAAVSVKNEGILWWTASAVGVVLVSAHHRLSPRVWSSGLLAALAPGAVVFLLWRLLCRQLGVESSLLAGLRWDLLGERVGPLSAAMAGQILSHGNALILLACAAALLVATRGLSRAERIGTLTALLAAPCVLLAGLFVVYVATPHDLVWHLETSLRRTLMGLVPAVFVATLLAPRLRGILERDARAAVGERR